jgi:hypothetical protein
MGASQKSVITLTFFVGLSPPLRDFCRRDFPSRR